MLSSCLMTRPYDASENFSSSVPELIILMRIGSPSLKFIFSVTIDNEVPLTYTNCSSTPYSYKKIPNIGPATTPKTIAKIKLLGNKLLFLRRTSTPIFWVCVWFHDYTFCLKSIAFCLIFNLIFR